MSRTTDDTAAIASRARVFRGASLQDVQLLRDALPALPPATLLHAGPPYASRELPAPVRNAAVHAMLFEGLAANEADAMARLAAGSVRLEPAQDHGILTPLAQVLSPSMPVFVVGDDTVRCCAPIAESAPPTLRFGAPDEHTVARLRAQARLALQELAPALRASPLDIEPIVARALADGDDCHSRTAAANAALVAALPDLSDGYRSQIAANPGFVLTIIMAASAWALRTSANAGPLPGIEAAGGNGIEFGIRRKQASGWHTIAATPPRGPFFPGKTPACVLGAIGDSAVIDMAGLGGQALCLAPDLVGEWQDILPADWAGRTDAIVDPRTGLVCAQRIVASGKTPLIHLAMLDAGERGGIVGRGFYEPALAVFQSLHTAGEPA